MDPALDANLRHILDAISDGVYVTSDEREIVYWSAGAERITGYRADEVVGKHCYDNILVHTDMHGKHLCLDGCPLQDCIRHGTERSVSEVFLKRKDGERLAVYVKTATFTDSGRVFGVEIFGELKDVAGAGLAARMQEVSDSSVTDPLSGLFNRRYFDAALEQSFAMYQRLGRRYGVLSVDVDRFKTINDTFGHATGDRAIQFVASVLSTNARNTDVTARYGGDEFAVIFPAASSEELDAYACRLATLVRESCFIAVDPDRFPLAISIGAALVDTTDTDARAAVERADRLMYDAKRAGGDRAATSAPAPDVGNGR